MSFPYTPNVQDEKIESLQTQYEYMKIVRLRHLQWLNSAENSEIESVHLQIAELIDLIADRYNHLLRAVPQQTDKE